MNAKFEIIASGSHDDAIKAGQKFAKQFAKGASNISIQATRIKKANHWKVILKYQRNDHQHKEQTHD